MTKMSLQTESNSIHEDHAALLLSNQTCCEDAIFSASLHILCQVCVVVFKSELVYQFPANMMPLGLEKGQDPILFLYCYKWTKICVSH